MQQMFAAMSAFLHIKQILAIFKVKLLKSKINAVN